MQLQLLLRTQEKQSKNKKAKNSWFLKAKRYLVEQFNGYFKANLLKSAILNLKLAKKTIMVYAAPIGCDVEALQACFDDFSLVNE